MISSLSEREIKIPSFRNFLNFYKESGHRDFTDLTGKVSRAEVKKKLSLYSNGGDILIGGRSFTEIYEDNYSFIDKEDFVMTLEDSSFPEKEKVFENGFFLSFEENYFAESDVSSLRRNGRAPVGLYNTNHNRIVLSIWEDGFQPRIITSLIFKAPVYFLAVAVAIEEQLQINGWICEEIYLEDHKEINLLCDKLKGEIIKKNRNLGEVISFHCCGVHDEFFYPRNKIAVFVENIGVVCFIKDNPKFIISKDYYNPLREIIFSDTFPQIENVNRILIEDIPSFLLSTIEIFFKSNFLWMEVLLIEETLLSLQGEKVERSAEPLPELLLRAVVLEHSLLLFRRSSQK